MFELCVQTARTGKRGHPRQTLPKGCRVRIKKIREAGSQPSVVSSTIIKAKPVIKPKVAGV